MEYYRVAALVPLTTQYIWIRESSPLMAGGFEYMRGTALLSTTKDLFDFIWNDWNYLLVIVLILRYYRLFMHILAYLFWYEPTPVPDYPTVTARNVHVIIPTVDPENKDFVRCVQSVLSHAPGFITVVTANEEITARAQIILANLPAQNRTFIRVMTGPMANKRRQLTHVLDDLARNNSDNKDTIVVFVDDHVWWPSPSYLVHLIAPFENPKVGIVATNKRVQRERGRTFADSFLNFIACIYLERHNFEMTATNAIDGGVFVVSGRTCAVRASIVMRKDFREGYTDERFFFNMFGPLNPDDDNYITRYMVRNDFDIKVQNMGLETLMETALGTVGGYKKFRGQLLRWCRTQWRSNATTLFTDRTVWRRQPWSIHAIFITWFFNFALITDSLIVYLWSQSNWHPVKIYHVLALIWGSKMVKLVPFFWRNPQDLWLFPAYVLFAYFHSFIKLWTLFTFFDHSWSGRDLPKIGMATCYSSSDDETTSNDVTDDVNQIDCTKGHYQPLMVESVFSAYESGADLGSHRQKPYGTGQNTLFADFHSLSSQSSRSMSISTRSRASKSSSFGGRSSYGFHVPSISSHESSENNGFRVPSISSGTSSIASTNTMLDKYGKLQGDETPNGYTPEGSFSTTHNYATPWGGVTTKSPHLTPANVRLSQSPSPPPTSRSPTPPLTLQSPKPTMSSITLPSTTPVKSTNVVRMLPTPPPSTAKPALHATPAKVTNTTTAGDSDDDFEPLFDNIDYSGEPEFVTDSDLGSRASPSPSSSPSPSLNSNISPKSLPLLSNSHTLQPKARITPSPTWSFSDLYAGANQLLQTLNSSSPHPTTPQNTTVSIPQPTTTTSSVANPVTQPAISTSSSNSSSKATVAEKQKYIRDFLRGHDCGRIHADGSNLVSSGLGGGMRCRAPPVKSLPNRYVVKGRPRF